MSSKMFESQTIVNPSHKKSQKIPINPNNYKIVDDLQGQEVKPHLNFRK